MKKPDTLAAATWLISSALLEVEDLEAALTNTLDVISTQLKAEGGAIWILNEDTGTLHCAACTGPLDLMGVSFESGIGTEGQVVSTETSVFLAETEKTESFEGDIFDDQGLKTRSLICVPLNDLKKTIGCMCLVTARGGSLFTEEDLKICEHTSALAAMVIDEKGFSVYLPPEKPVLMELKGITKEFLSGEEVLKVLQGINLKIFKNEFVVVLGESGCGKSTMMNIIGGMDRATSGTIELEGMNFTAPNEKALTEFRRSYIGFIFQSYNLMPNLTARENIQFIAEISENPGNVDDALAMVGLTDRAGNFPSQLSGGQQQRISIARAIVKNPHIILADEPTAALDFKTGQEVLRVIESIVQKGNTTVLMVTHNVEIAKMADRVVKLRSGKVSSIKYNAHPLHANELVW